MPRRHAASAWDPQLARVVTWRPSTAARPPLPGELHDDMVKSYETLVDSNAGVDVNTGMVAARRLQSLIDSRDYSRDIAELRFQVGQISDAVRSVVPESMWGAIIEKLEELEQHSQALESGRTPSTLMTPMIRSSSSTRTTSIDLHSAHSHRG